MRRQDTIHTQKKSVRSPWQEHTIHDNYFLHLSPSHYTLLTPPFHEFHQAYLPEHKERQGLWLENETIVLPANNGSYSS